MKRIVDSICREAFANDKQAYRHLAVVDERVSQPCTRHETHAISNAQGIQATIDPEVWLTLEHEDELLFVFLGVGPRGATPQ